MKQRVIAYICLVLLAGCPVNRDVAYPHSVTSALQRARANLRSSLSERPARSAPAAPTNVERELVARLLDATERGDAKALADMAVADTDVAA